METKESPNKCMLELGKDYIGRNVVFEAPTSRLYEKKGQAYILIKDFKNKDKNTNPQSR